MSLWTDLATWRGPTPNQGGSMAEQRGVVLHIAQGSFDGTIAWQQNPAAQVSSHFVVAEDGRIAQMVDTDITAWTQAAGNGHWMSIENAGFSGNPLTPAQVEACARLYARGVQEYGWPLQATDSTSGQGLGWHGMGGNAWGGHPDCPGQPIINQRGEILTRAAQLLNQPSFLMEEKMITLVPGPNGALWACDGMLARELSQKDVDDLRYIAAQGAMQLWHDPADGSDVWKGGLVPAFGIDVATLTGGGAGSGGPTHAELAQAAFEGAQRAEKE